MKALGVGIIWGVLVGEVAMAATLGVGGIGMILFVSLGILGTVAATIVITATN